MGLINLGSVNINSILKSATAIGQTATTSPVAKNILLSVAGDLFSTGKATAYQAVAGSNMSPLAKTFAQVLAPYAFDVAQIGFDRAVQAVTGQPATVTTADGLTVTTPPLNQPGRLESIYANGPVSQYYGAATGQGGPTSGGLRDSADALATDWGWKGGPPNAKNYNLKDPTDQARFQSDLACYGMAMNCVNNTFQQKSNIEKNQSDAAKAILGNYR